MTPEERRLIDGLFDRLAGLENTPRDREAERAIIDGLRRAPNAAYALVQTALVQDEALKRANARIEELQDNAQAPQASTGSFLDPMRNAVWGQDQSHGSVPDVRPIDNGTSRGAVWNSGQVLNSGYADTRSPGYAPAPASYSAPSAGGGSFLGTAAAAAAGMIGGSLLMSSIRGLMGGHQAFGDAGAWTGDTRSESRSPWSADQSNNDLARDAGLNDIGGDGGRSNEQNQRLFDIASNDDQSDGDAGGFDSDGFGGDDGNDV